MMRYDVYRVPVLVLQLVMLKKGIRYSVHPTLATRKPDWLVEKHSGAMPALVHKDKTLTDPLAIAEYLEKTYHHSSLTRQGAYSYQEVLERTTNFFPTLSAFILNKDATKDEELGAAVEAQLDIIDDIIKTTPGHYTCGIEMTLADLYLAPQLFHVSLTGVSLCTVGFRRVSCCLRVL
jgi:glutathione S-transferase